MDKKGTLALTRKCGESIMIGDDIQIYVHKVHAARRVRLVVQAPKDVAVHRTEVYRKIHEAAE